MLAINNPEAIIEEPIRETIIRRERPFPQHPGNAPGCPDSLHREKPPNQAAYHEWVHAVFMRVFHCVKRLEGMMLTVDSPIVKRLGVYGASLAPSVNIQQPFDDGSALYRFAPGLLNALKILVQDKPPVQSQLVHGAGQGA